LRSFITLEAETDTMRIGVPKEIKVHEYRVGMTPASVREAAAHGHDVYVEHDAATRQGVSDEDYARAGAKILSTAADVFASADLIVKVKEPQPAECKLLREGQTLFTYLHLAPDPEQAKALLHSGVTAIAYETVTNGSGGLPLLAPMSEVAGRMAVQAGAHCLEMEQGGRGMLLGGVAGVAPAKVVVLGGGVAGVNALRMAIGLEAQVSVLDINLQRLYAIDQQFSATINTIFSTRQAVEDYVLDADLVIGAVLVPGASAPKLLSQQHVRDMKVALRLLGRRHMPNPPMWCMTWCTTVLPTCLAPSHAHRPSHSTTRRCLSYSLSPARAWQRP
jgi:alanine dehydrogenase